MAHTVTGGAQEYVARLTRSFSHRIRTSCGAAEITRTPGGPAGNKVQIRDTAGGSESYDQLVMACHGDEALALLQDCAGGRACRPVRFPLPEKMSRCCIATPA